MNTMVSSPLEQFQIVPLTSFSILGYDISFTNSAFFAVVSILFFFLLLNFSSKSFLVPTRWQSLIEGIYDFSLTVVKEQIGAKGKAYMPLVFAIFSYILVCNMTGMIPYSFTPTSHIAITFGLAFAMFTGINIVAFQKHGLHFFSFFLPAGAPTAMAPLFVGIEVFSYVFRVVSLSVRLFANLTSGHALLKILAGFGWTMLSAGGVVCVMSVFPIGLVFAITGLELAIAFLQAYVFSVLVCLYLKDAIDLH
uniref:ATP synthase subunit a n=1 Tax=Ophirina amphinema TaxID=2108040 RepID=A0A348AYU5_9EUKA|nr:ATP synthase F0 subunit a [Ophirina amphinema]